MKMLIKIHDDNKFWKITGAEMRDDGYPVNPYMFFEASKEIYEFIEEKLKNNNILIKKEQLTPDVKKEDFILDEVDFIDKLREVARSTYYKSFQFRCGPWHMMELYNFMNAYNYLAAKGIYITEENKDDVYIQIIKSENEEDVKILEKYLYAKDYLSVPYRWFNEYIKFEEDLDCADSKEEIDEILQNALDKIQ